MNSKFVLVTPLLLTLHCSTHPGPSPATPPAKAGDSSVAAPSPSEWVVTSRPAHKGPEHRGPQHKGPAQERPEAMRSQATTLTLPAEARDSGPQDGVEPPQPDDVAPLGLARFRSAIENYTPSAPPEAALPRDAGSRTVFSSYIESMHARIHSFLAQGALPRLDRLPQDHLLQNRAQKTDLELVVDGRDGGLVRMGVLRSSGTTAFDVLVLESVLRAAPFGAAPEEIRSADGLVYLHWEFHRDPEYACSTYFARPFLLAKPTGDDPVLRDFAGRVLPQTKEKPSIASPRFRRNAHLLFEAIVSDDVEKAFPFFFPQVAYEQVKDIVDPAGDWKSRLVAAYAKDIHEYHRALGKHRGEATFQEMRVAESLARWVRPGEELNKVGYYRVMRSVLVYRDHVGRPRELGIVTMISWRGEWYVVHLRPFH